MKFSKVSFKNFRKAAILKQLAVVAIVAVLLCFFKSGGIWQFY